MLFTQYFHLPNLSPTKGSWDFWLKPHGPQLGSLSPQEANPQGFLALPLWDEKEARGTKGSWQSTSHTHVLFSPKPHFTEGSPDGRQSELLSSGPTVLGTPPWRPPVLTGNATSITCSPSSLLCAQKSPASPPQGPSIRFFLHQHLCEHHTSITYRGN